VEARFLAFRASSISTLKILEELNVDDPINHLSSLTGWSVAGVAV